jgi:transketolase C-terminal domain/subunit
VKAALALSEEYPDFTFTLISLLQIHPLVPDPALYDAAASADRLLFVEEHIRSGGIGENLASDSRIRRNVPIHAIEEPSVPCGDLESITKLCRMDPDSIAERIREEIGKTLKYRIEIE